MSTSRKNRSKITSRMMIFMAVNVVCPKCGHKWVYKGNAVKATCTSCYNKVQVRALPDPGPAKVPAGVKALGKKALGQPMLQEGQCIRGKVSMQRPDGKEVEDIVIPCPRHTVRPLVAREVVGSCKVCGDYLRERPQLNVMVDERERLHSTCFLTKIILESGGDLQAAAHLWNVSMEALQKRAMRLVELGKLPETVLV